MMNAERLRELLQYDPASGVFRWNVSNRRGVSLGKIAGHAGHHGYCFIRVDRKLYTAHRLAWLHYFGEWPSRDIDHKDGNPSNNCIANLRLASTSQNIANAKKSCTNRSGFRGVSWARKESKWRAYITKDRKRKHLGYFATADQAAEAYRSAATSLFGEFARP